jgi:translation initiation factor IF-2
LGQEEDVAVLNLIIRADVRGSIEAILKELGKFEHPEVKIKVLQASVGGISVADVTLAHASGAVIIGFNVIPDEAARALAEQRQVEIRRYEIIYKLTDDIKALLEGKLKPEERIVELGAAFVKQVFAISRVGSVAGCQVIRGSIERGCRIRVNRDSRTIGDYAMESLKREKDDAKEVNRGMECGIKLANFNDVKEGDLLEAYKIEEVARTL